MQAEQTEGLGMLTRWERLRIVLFGASTTDSRLPTTTQVAYKFEHSLSSVEKNVLERRFGLKDGRELTLREVGKERGVSAQRIAQIESKALRKLRIGALLPGYAAQEKKPL